MEEGRVTRGSMARPLLSRILIAFGVAGFVAGGLNALLLMLGWPPLFFGAPEGTGMKMIGSGGDFFTAKLILDGCFHGALLGIGVGLATFLTWARKPWLAGPAGFVAGAVAGWLGLGLFVMGGGLDLPIPVKGSLADLFDESSLKIALLLGGGVGFFVTSMLRSFRGRLAVPMGAVGGMLGAFFFWCDPLGVLGGGFMYPFIPTACVHGGVYGSLVAGALRILPRFAKRTPEDAQKGLVRTEPDRAIPIGESLTCKACNEAVSSETVFCPGCGEQLREPPKEKPAAAKEGKTGLIVGIVGALVVLGGGAAAAVFALGVFDKPVTPPPPPPVQTGPSAADIKKAVDKRVEVGLAMRDRDWDAAEQKLNVARLLHPDHEENDVLAGKIRVERAKELYDKQYRPRRHTPDGRPLEVPDCWRAAVSIGGSTVAMIVAGSSGAMDTVLAAESITAEQRWKKALALEGEGASLWAICISADNTALVVGGTDGVLRVHALHDGREVDRVAHAGTPADLAVTLDDVVALNGDGSVTLYKYNPLRKGETIEPAKDALPVMALDPKHQWVVVGGKTALRVAYFGKRLPDRRLPIEGENLAALAVSPDGTTIAAATGDGTVFFFEAQTGKEIGRGSAGGQISQIAFDPSGRMVMVWWRETGVLRYLTAPELDFVVEFDTGLSGTTTRLAWAANGGALAAVATKGQSSTYAVFRLKDAD